MSVGRSSELSLRAPALRLPRAGTSRAYLEIAGWWAASRLFVLVCALVAQVVRWPVRSWHPSPFAQPLVLLGAWDGQWYRLVAEHGYLLIPAQPSDPAFFPLLPVAENGLSLIGIPPLVAGALVANLGLLAGLIAMYELGRALLPESQARRAAVYLAIFPYGFVFSMAYPEGLALALVALTGLLALRRHWLGAGAAVAAATLTRPQGVFLMLPVAAAAWAAWDSLSDRERSQAVAAVLAGPAALASFSVYLWHTVGNPMAWSKAELAWGRSFSLLGPYRAVHQLILAPSQHDSWLLRDAAFCAVYLALLAVARRSGVPWPWVLCGLAMVLLPIGSGTFTSDGRFGLLALPVFWGLAALGRHRLIDRLVLAVSPVLLVLAVLTLHARYP
jgi:hypothetical protein